VFAFGKEDGGLRWQYEAMRAVHHDAIAIGEGAVYLIDRTSAAERGRMKRRGDRPIIEETLVALEPGTGETLWTADRGLAKREELRYAKGVLLATGGGRMTAYAAEDGKMLSWSGAAMRGFPVVVGDTIYGEPRAYDLQTGEAKARTHPLTGEEVPWIFARSYGCGAISASLNLLLFRSGAVGFCDLADDSGTHNFGGVRAGCYVNAIVANGLVFMPPADAACTCSYSYQTTVALAPMPTNEGWSVFTAQQVAEGQPVRHVALNLGAVGDRRAEDGTLWLSFPRPPTGQALQVPVTVELAANGRYYRENANQVRVEGTPSAWLYASGGEGGQTITLNVGPGEDRSFTVRLHFAEIADLQPGGRVFDVRVQDQPVAESLDVVAEAKGTRRVLLKEVRGVKASDTLKIELYGRSGRPPVLSALEIREE
jgi:outer membrane protein assembly factor BamB